MLLSLKNFNKIIPGITIIIIMHDYWSKTVKYKE